MLDYIISCAPFTPPPTHPHSRTHTYSDDHLDGYQKKYVCKLLFIFLLGNDVDFGHQEAVNLLAATRFSEKQIVRNVFYICTVLKARHLSDSVFCMIIYEYMYLCLRMVWDWL